MPYLYRTALIVRRKQPYFDWANSLDEANDPKLTPDLLKAPEIYLGPDAQREQTLDEAVGDVWSEIFAEALFSWYTDESRWPQERTRELFHEWFDVELAESVIDLVPDEPLTDDDMDAIDLETAGRTCGWCGTELLEDMGRLVKCLVADLERLRDREGCALPLVVDSERVAMGVLTPTAAEGEPGALELVIRACSRPCEKHLLKQVPKALRELELRLGSSMTETS